MKAYQADIAKFEAAGAKVFGLSTDNSPSQAHWAKEEGFQFPILSDFLKKTSADYGVLAPSGVSNRTTFVVNAEGKIEDIIEGSGAIDPSSALTSCSRLKH